MIIFGTRAYVRALGMVTFICQNCRNPAAHRIAERVTRFTLFFIPLFPIGRSYLVACTFCGASTKIKKDLAQEYLVYSPSGAPGQQAAYGGHPTSLTPVPNGHGPAAGSAGEVTPPQGRAPEFPPRS